MYKFAEEVKHTGLEKDVSPQLSYRICQNLFHSILAGKDQTGQGSEQPGLVESAHGR